MTTLIEIYKEHRITYVCGFYWTLGVPFKTLKAAKKEIDLVESYITL